MPTSDWPTRRASADLRAARRARRRASRCPSRPPTRGRSSSTRPRARIAATFPAAPTSTATSAGRSSSSRSQVDPEEVERAYRAVEEWRRFEPEVDLYVAPCIGIDLPPEDCDELEVRLPLSAFLRWVNLLGWAGLAIGNLQLIAPHDETVLAAGLAWERG